LRLEITTLAPSFAKSSAEERPMPRLEPVMTATFPVRSNGVPFTARAPFLFLIGLSFATRHCEERKRRSNPFFLFAARWIASRSLSSGGALRRPGGSQ
jgi:hypothetical protein